MSRFAFYRLSAVVLCVLMASLPFVVFASEPMPQQQGFVTNTPMSSPAEATPVATSAPTVAAPPATADTSTADTDNTELVDDAGEPVVLNYPAECDYVPGESTNQACIEFMNANLEPPVTNTVRDATTLSQYSFWRVGPEAVTTFASPNGEANGTIPQGFNFVNVVSQTDGWIQAEDGDWIRMEDGYSVPASEFTGVLLPEDWTLPFGWILDITGIYASSVPGGEPDSNTGLVPLHYERFNIYDEVLADDGWVYYLVGPDQWVKQIYMTVIKPTPRPDDVFGRWVAVDLFEQSLVAYDGNRPVFATLISTGLPGTETNEGVFEVWARLERDGMSGATGAPNAYALQSVPWVQYFDDGISLHGTYWHDLFGYRRSRGCVNLSISDSRWVYDFFTPTAQAGDPSFVYVHSTGEFRGEG
ncbi:MAG: L,D-transpeptidase family protein [Chloroflexota bacterium]